MSASLEDQLFQRFCRTGDPSALAEVFDRTAPELLRVAAHVSGDPQSAEDLLQDTFLAALESAHAWDASRRLVPWLVGILTHRAQTLRRQARREPDRERVRREAVVDPSDEAQRAETWRELDRAIRAQPEVYQTPLVLHLRHGLNANEIAEAMRRPAGTVRAQLSRGMELVRKTLPVGIALSLMPVRGLAAVRAVVLARGEAVAVGVGWGATSLGVVGVLLMKKTLVAVVGIALVAASVFMAWPAPPVPIAVTAGEGLRGTAVAQAPSGPRATPVSAASREIERVPVVVPSATPSLLVRARFADGAPAEGAVVTVRPANGNTFDPREQAAMVTADGTARFTTLAPGQWLVHGDRGGRASVEVSAHGETVCELEIPRGILVRGHVRDEAQLPIAGARVWLSRSSIQGGVVAHTGPDGAFALRDVAPEREVSALAEGFAPSRCRVVVGKPGEAVDVELVLVRSEALLSGTVVDRLGRGVAGALVCVGARIQWLGAAKGARDPNERRARWSQPPLLEVRTDPAGRFRVAGVALANEPLAAAVSAEGFAPWTGMWQASKESAPGEATVTLLRGATVRGVVRDTDGHPLADVTIQASSDRGRSAGPLVTGEDGAFTFEHLPAETLNVGARKRGVGRVVTSIALHDEQELRWDPVLGTGPYLIGRVIDERGQPLVGWRVGAVAPNWASPQAQFDTDTNGRFRIPECTQAPYTVEVYDPSAPIVPLQPVASVPQAQPDSGEIVLVVEDGRRASGFVTARVVGADGEPIADATVMLWRTPRNSSVDEHTDAQGQYRSYLLVPGTFDLRIAAAGYGDWEKNGVVVASHVTTDLGTIQLERAGHVVASVRGADPARTAPFLGVHLLNEAGLIACGVFTRQDDGTWRSATVPAGRYSVVFWPEGTAVSRVPVEVPHGGEVRVELNVESGIPCRFAFAGADDPGATWHIDWKTGGGEWLARDVRSRFTGTLTRRFAPGTWAVEIRAEDGRTARKEFTVSATDRALDVQVPAPTR